MKQAVGFFLFAGQVYARVFVHKMVDAFSFLAAVGQSNDALFVAARAEAVGLQIQRFVQILSQPFAEDWVTDDTPYRDFACSRPMSVAIEVPAQVVPDQRGVKVCWPVECKRLSGSDAVDLKSAHKLLGGYLKLRSDAASPVSTAQASSYRVCALQVIAEQMEMIAVSFSQSNAQNRSPLCRATHAAVRCEEAEPIGFGFGIHAIEVAVVAFVLAFPLWPRSITVPQKDVANRYEIDAEPCADIAESERFIAKILRANLPFVGLGELGLAHA